MGTSSISFLDSVYSSYRKDYFLSSFREQYKNFFEDVFVLTLDSLSNLLSAYSNGFYDFHIDVTVSDVISVKFVRSNNE